MFANFPWSLLSFVPAGQRQSLIELVAMQVTAADTIHAMLQSYLTDEEKSHGYWIVGTCHYESSYSWEVYGSNRTVIEIERDLLHTDPPWREKVYSERGYLASISRMNRRVFAVATLLVRSHVSFDDILRDWGATATELRATMPAWPLTDA